jgi:hypothetical protein
VPAADPSELDPQVVGQQTAERQPEG